MLDNKIIHKFCYEVNGYINSVSRIYNEIIEGSFDFDIKAAKKVGADFKNDLCSACAKGFGGEPIHLAFLSFEPAWVTVVISGVPLLYLAIWRIIHNPGISKISSALLICIAMFAAIAIGDLFAAGEVAFIMAIGALLEEATTNRAKKGLKQLINLAPTKGRRLTNGKEEIIPAEEIIQEDVLRILPGETIQVDGIIISGETSVDQSIMTGESLPVALLIAILAYIFTRNIVTAVTVLVVFCPCALVLATPTAIMAAIGQATKHGVIIKSGEALEKMGKVDMIALW